MNISNSRLRIVKLDYSNGDTKISGIDKSQLRYQKVLFINTKTVENYVLGVGSGTISIPNAIRRGGYDEAYVITKGNPKAGKEKYTGLEKDIMLRWLKVLYPSHLDTAELLVGAIGYENITKMFYESYGTEMIREFYRKIDDIVAGYSSGTKEKTKYVPQYQRSRYSIHELIEDLVQAKVMIYTDPDLLGEYRRISRGTKTPTGSKKLPDKWCRINGITGNRTRANMSLGYSCVVSVDVPENTVGVEPGPRELTTARSYCIIKDGVLWSKYLGIKTSDKNLVRKLKSSGIIEMGIVYDDEYLLDLQRLPVISKSKIKNITSWSMARAELNVELDKWAGTWARRMAWMEKKSLLACPKTMSEPEDPAVEFLHSLGIYGNTYIPRVEADKVKDSYKTFELIGCVSGVPKDPTASVINYINKVSHRTNPIISEYLDSIVKEHKNSGRTYQESVEYYEKKLGKDIKTLRDLKFRFILGKTLKFSDKQRSKVENVRVSMPVKTTADYKGKLGVSWRFEKTTVEI